MSDSRLFSSSYANNHNQSGGEKIKKKLEDFQLEGEGDLGRGAFGTVRLVKDQTNGKLYALKIVCCDYPRSRRTVSRKVVYSRLSRTK